MTAQDKTKIANSFSDKFNTFHPDVKLTVNEFQIFEEGIYANGMDDKWNIFVLGKFMYWARSRTNTCIYKVQVNKRADFVLLEKVFVNRDKTQYLFDHIEKEKILFLQLLQFYLGRDDIYVDPEFHIELVKEILRKYQPLDKYIKSIGRQSVDINKMIYQSILEFGADYAQKTGWTDFYEKIKNRNENEEILSLYLQEKGTNKGTTYYMDNGGNHLISVVVPMDISSR